MSDKKYWCCKTEQGYVVGVGDVEITKTSLTKDEAHRMLAGLNAEWVGLALSEMDAIIDGNMRIEDTKLRDAVYAVVIDTMTTLMEKNYG